MSWYRTGTVTVTNGSKNVTGVGTLWASSVNAGDAFSLVDANLNPTGAWYEVESVTNNTTLVLKQSYAGTTGSNKTYCVFNLVGNMTTPSFAQRLAQFFDSFQGLIDKPTTTPTASSIPIADASGDIDSGWIKDATASVKGVVELATNAETTAGQDATRAVTPAGFLAGLRGNIRGTVSVSGGVPTGAVIERGSNTNGEYVRFADGTLICTKLLSFTDGAIVWDFPSVFANPSLFGVSILPRVSNGATQFVIPVVDASVYVTGSSITFSGFITSDAGSSFARISTGTGCYLTATGRWF